MGHRQESAERPKSVEIAFGTLFTVRRFGVETPRIDCITDVGEDTYFCAGQVQKSTGGKDKLNHVGTGGPENFGTIVGQMSLTEVIEAFREGARDGWVFNDSMETILRESALKAPRVLILNR